jgi:hypothetical protein
MAAGDDDAMVERCGDVVEMCDERTQIYYSTTEIVHP